MDEIWEWRQERAWGQVGLLLSGLIPLASLRSRRERRDQGGEVSGSLRVQRSRSPEGKAGGGLGGSEVKMEAEALGIHELVQEELIHM